jgi:hypothetical protein
VCSPVPPSPPLFNIGVGILRPELDVTIATASEEHNRLRAVRVYHEMKDGPFWYRRPTGPLVPLRRENTD